MGAVCVTPWRLPANMIVAPNSPSAHAHPSAAPTPRPADASGTATRRNTFAGPAQSVCAAANRARPNDGHAHEGHRHHNSESSERDLEAQRVELRGQHAGADEGGEEPKTGDGRRQH